ncbi:hypothetical protein PHMEG_00031227 [Phytophthora megakarya]|uniref:Retroviral polymerase SH3-like domain-containing protein n=1 Tax=Phytophthora megakarya TaxID=4795 RepID=A0A225UZV1_9STRA|nr:hypothetical protein PHMEG_00031227 [Phytophthora megakarya]
MIQEITHPVFHAKMKAAAAKQFEHFLAFFEERYDCMIHVLRTDSGGRYQNVDLFSKKTGERGSAQIAHELKFGESVTDEDVGKADTVSGRNCGARLVYRKPKTKNFVHRAEQGYIVGVGEEVKGYGVYLPQNKKVITTQHVKNSETMDKVQNKQYLKGNEDDDADESARELRNAAEAVSAGDATSRGKIGKKSATKKEKN